MANLDQANPNYPNGYTPNGYPQNAQPQQAPAGQYAYAPAPQQPQAPYSQTPPAQYAYAPRQPVPSVQQLPPEYRPLSPWAYFGYTLLFSIPIVGFVFLIVYSFSSANINRRNFARSFWCMLLIAGIILLIALLLGLLYNGSLLASRYYP